MRLFNIAVCAAVIFSLCTGCRKKEVQNPPRCIYDQTVFAEIFRKAANDEKAFLCFKREPFFNLLWENVTQEEGERWLEKIQRETPSLIEKLERIRLNDQIGSPRVYPFGMFGLFSPSTLRLAAIAGDIELKLGSLDNLNVVQIGAGYGGLCSVLQEVARCKSYTLVDLPEQLALAKKYLEKRGVNNVHFLTPEELPRQAVYDVVLSDMNFSEFSRPYQELFIEKILSYSRSGYLLGRTFPKHFGVVPLSLDELKRRLEKMGKNASWDIQEKARDRENYFIHWNKE